SPKLDTALQSAFITRRTGGAWGVRVARALTPRWSLEWSFDDGFARTRVTDGGRVALDNANATFLSTFNALLSFPTRQSSVSSVSSIDDGRGHQFVTTGAVAIHFAERRRLAPYATIGARAAICR